MLWNLQQIGRQECSAFLSFKLLFWGSFHLRKRKFVPIQTTVQSLFRHLQPQLLLDGREREREREMRPTLSFCTVSSTGGCAQSLSVNWNQLVLSEHFRSESSPPRREKGELLMQLLLMKSVVPSVRINPIVLWVEQSCCLKQGQSRHKPFWHILNLKLAGFKRRIPFFQLCLSSPLKSKPPDHEVCFIAGALLHAVVGILRDRHALVISVAFNTACRAGADGPIIPSKPCG